MLLRAVSEARALGFANSPEIRSQNLEHVHMCPPVTMSAMRQNHDRVLVRKGR